MASWQSANRVVRRALGAAGERLTRAAAGERLTRASLTPSPPPSPAIDREALDRRFRGSPDALQTLHTARYLETLYESQPVLDVGCGQGGLLAALAQVGAEASGVETDPAMVAACRAKGLDVVRSDAIDHLRARAPGSVGSIAALGLVEHLGADALVEFLRLSSSRLQPGGVLVVETPNPAALVVLGNSWLLDPARAQPPVHPALLSFLCERAGFVDLDVRFWPATDGTQLRMIDDPDAPPWADRVNEGFAHLNRVLFGPREYSVTAHTPAPATPGTPPTDTPAQPGS